MKFKRRSTFKKGYSPVKREELVDKVNAARHRLGEEAARGTTHAEYAIAEADFYAAEKRLREYDKKR